MRQKSAKGLYVTCEMDFIYIYVNKILRLEGDCDIMEQKEVWLWEHFWI